MKWVKVYQSLADYNNNKESLPVPHVVKVPSEPTGKKLKWREEDYFEDKYLTTTATS